MIEHCIVLTSECPPFTLGGIGRYVREIVPRLGERLRVSVVLVPTYHWQRTSGGDAPMGGIPVAVAGTAYRDALLAMNGFDDMRLLADAARRIALECVAVGGASECTCIYVQDYALAPIAAELRQRIGSATVLAACHLPVYAGFTYFDRPISDAIHQVLEAKLVHLADRLVVPSAFAAHVLSLTHNVAGKIAVIPLGVERPVSPRVTRPDEYFRLLAVGRPTEQKGYHFLLQVVRELLRHGVGFRLTIVTGTQRNGRLHRLVDDVGLAAHVDVVAPMDGDAIWSAYDESHVFVTTSLYETFGLAILEAMASGVPTFGFPVGAVPELWGPELVHDLATPVADIHRLAARVASVAGDPARLRDLGLRCRVRAQEFTWSRHVRALAAAMTPSSRRPVRAVA